MSDGDGADTDPDVDGGWMSPDVTRIAVENSSIGMGIVDPSSGRFVEVNRALCDYLGRDRSPGSASSSSRAHARPSRRS